MAKQVENQKGFLVLEISREEMLDRLSEFGCLGICDGCMNPTSVGYYIAVLNMWMCEGCYKEFVRTATRYKEDEWAERKNFDTYLKIFELKEAS